MKRLAMFAVFFLAVGSGPARAIEVLVNHTPLHFGAQASHLPVLRAMPSQFVVPGPISELPEPEIIAMMLVGLALIGYRATRESTDTFN